MANIVQATHTLGLVAPRIEDAVPAWPSECLNNILATIFIQVIMLKEKFISLFLKEKGKVHRVQKDAPVYDQLPAGPVIQK